MLKQCKISKNAANIKDNVKSANFLESAIIKLLLLIVVSSCSEFNGFEIIFFVSLIKSILKSLQS